MVQRRVIFFGAELASLPTSAPDVASGERDRDTSRSRSGRATLATASAATVRSLDVR